MAEVGVLLRELLAVVRPRVRARVRAGADVVRVLHAEAGRAARRGPSSWGAAPPRSRSAARRPRGRPRSPRRGAGSCRWRRTSRAWTACRRRPRPAGCSCAHAAATSATTRCRRRDPRSRRWRPSRTARPTPRRARSSAPLRGRGTGGRARGGARSSGIGPARSSSTPKGAPPPDRAPTLDHTSGCRNPFASAADASHRRADDGPLGAGATRREARVHEGHQLVDEERLEAGRRRVVALAVAAGRIARVPVEPEGVLIGPGPEPARERHAVGRDDDHVERRLRHPGPGVRVVPGLGDGAGVHRRAGRERLDPGARRVRRADALAVRAAGAVQVVDDRALRRGRKRGIAGGRDVVAHGHLPADRLAGQAQAIDLPDRERRAPRHRALRAEACRPGGCGCGDPCPTGGERDRDDGAQPTRPPPPFRPHGPQVIVGSQ